MNESTNLKQVQMEFEVPGTPEQVWQAIATGPGISCWLFPTQVEEREGGKVDMQMGPGMSSEGVVTTWEPPIRFGYEEPNWAVGAPPLGTEFTIEAKSGDACVVRLVHSLFTDSNDWDDQIASFETGWPQFFDVLRVYMTHFAGQTCAPVRLMGSTPEGEAEAWTNLKDALGISASEKGEYASAGAEGFPSFSGTVDRLGRGRWNNELMLVLDEPSPGIALMGVYEWGGVQHPSMSLYFYGEQGPAVVAEREAAWNAWFAARYPAEAE